MNNPLESSYVKQYLLAFGSWDSKGNSFEINVTRDIIYIKSSTQDFSYIVNLKLKVEFQKFQGLYTGIVIDGRTYNAQHKDLYKFKELISARATFLSIQNEYYLTKKMGEGGQEEVIFQLQGVYEALQIESNETRAVKKYDKQTRSVKDIHKEIQLTQKFSYKNVVKIIEVYESQSSIFIIYEKLRIFVPDKYTPEQKYNFTYDLLNVVQLMHSTNYMHRDIKMANIMISDNEIKLVDFSLATKCKKYHKQCGTPGYMAPEIFQTREYNEKCDIYSLGIVIYEMFTNEQLFVGLNKNDIKNKNQMGLFNTDKLMRLPSGTQELIRYMLISDPNTRISARIAKRFNIFNKEFDNRTDVSIINIKEYYK